MPPLLHFGLGSDGPFRAEIIFPSGIRVVHRGIAPDRKIMIYETEQTLERLKLQAKRVVLPWLRWKSYHLGLALNRLLLAALLTALGLGWHRCWIKWGSVLPCSHRGIFALGALTLITILWLWVVPWTGLGASYSFDLALGLLLPIGFWGGNVGRRVWRHLGANRVWKRLKIEREEVGHASTHYSTVRRLGLARRLRRNESSDAEVARSMPLYLEAIEEFKSRTAPRLRSLAGLACRHDDSFALGQMIIRGIMQGVKLDNESSPDDWAEVSSSLLSSIDDLEDEIMRRRSCDLRKAILSARRSQMREMVGAITFDRPDLNIDRSTRVAIREADCIECLEELIRNANRAVSDRSTQVIEVSATPVKNGVTILVDDSGPGIPPIYRRRVFKYGFTTRRQGTGKGLPMVKNVLDKCGGGIRITKSPLGGTRFIIHLVYATDD